MGAVDVLPATNVGSFQDSFRSLVTFDRIRITRIFEIIQYAFLFSIAAIFAGAVIDRLFAPLYPIHGEDSAPLKGTGESVHTVLTLALQVVVGALTVFYIRKVVDLIPPIVNLAPEVYIKHRGVSESQGEMSLAIIFVGIQMNAIRELEKLRNYGSNDGA